MNVRTLVVLFLPVWAATGVAQAQIDEIDQAGSGQAAYYNYASPTDVTIVVNVWGRVQHPGVYEVPRDMSLSRLFSLAGGPVIGARRTGRDQLLTVRLSRQQPETATREIVFETTMEDEVLTFEEDPILQDGDVLLAQTYDRELFTWRDVLSVLSGVGTTLLLIERVFRIIE